MSLRYLCLQGHLWVHEKRETPKEMFCPTCGLRLYAESQAPSIPIQSQHTFPADSPPRPPPLAPGGARGVTVDPTPMSNADIWRLNRSSIDGSVPAKPIEPGDIEAVPGYELLGILGRGGMGIVFRARQLSLKRQVALKMILTGRHARPSDRARFQREAEAVARLQHPNIVQIHEVGEQNGLPYCALEFVNAGSLAQFLASNPHSPRISAKFVHDLAQAMHYAHKRGIVHRDLKPANILLQLDESQILKENQMADTAIFNNLMSYVPKITDFGLAMHMGIEEGPHRHGAVVGTPSYMAPEQARGTSGEVGPAADVYALGAILYEMLTGRPPFKAATVEETAVQVLTQDPVPPTQLRPKVPRDLETICLVCLQKNPAHRYGSAEALAEDLRRFLANEPIRARRTHLPERVVKWASRWPRLAVVGLAGLVLTAFVLWLAWNRSVTLRAEKEQLQQAWQKSEDELDLAMQTIDQIAEQPDGLHKARTFYERLLDHGGPPARQALAHYRLGRIHERLGNVSAAESAYREAVRGWDQMAQTRQDQAIPRASFDDCRQRLEMLAGAHRP